MSRRYVAPLPSISGPGPAPGPSLGPDPVQPLSQSLCVSLSFCQLCPQLLHCVCVFVLHDVCAFSLVRAAVKLVHSFLTNTHKSYHCAFNFLEKYSFYSVVVSDNQKRFLNMKRKCYYKENVFDHPCEDQSEDVLSGPFFFRGLSEVLALRVELGPHTVF